MSKVAVFVSDLHLGRNDNLEDFVSDNERAFVEFLDRQSSDHRGGEVDLVILGDFLDIWQVVPDADKTAKNSSAIDVTFGVADEVDRVRRIVENHPNTFAALGRFLNTEPSQRRILCIPGNHDHSLVHGDVQAAVRNAIAGDTPSLKDKVDFPLWYEDPDVMAYAEHGNQYDENNAYEHFPAFGPECPGYYFVRVFWNRLENLECNADVWPKCFEAIIRNRLWRLIKPAGRYYAQYLMDERFKKKINIPGVPFFGADGEPLDIEVTGKTLPDFPELLFSNHGDPERIFSMDNATETHFRVLYHDPQDTALKNEIDEILKEKYPGVCMTVPQDPVLDPSGSFSLGVDDYVQAVRGMFDASDGATEKKNLMGSILSPATYRYVLFGHTHDADNALIPDLDVTYFNTGTWSLSLDAGGNNVSRPSFVTIHKADDGTVSAWLDTWSLNGPRPPRRP